MRYEIPKRRGGKRVILAPMTELKAIQRKIYHEILANNPVHYSVHGFVPGRSIITNAAPHVGKAVVLNMDLKDFFPSIGFRRVRGLFISADYSFAVANALALLCTERDRKPMLKGGKTVYVRAGERTLVQGAPTSPVLANLLARRMDIRLETLAYKCGMNYTRYADDLTFSGDEYGKMMAMQALVRQIIAEEGFVLNEEITRIYRQSNRQMVTGIVVNERVNTPRDLRRTVRAILHNAAKTGLAAQNRDNYPDFRAYLRGLIGHIHQANPDHAKPLLDMLNSVKD
jgi:retron-type reverse transcriptase